MYKITFLHVHVQVWTCTHTATYFDGLYPAFLALSMMVRSAAWSSEYRVGRDCSTGRERGIWLSTICFTTADRKDGGVVG